MALVAGADGCRRGWVVVWRYTTTKTLGLQIVGQIDEILAANPVVLCIDVPIGLLDRARRGGRDCDQAARKLLGPLRGRSVFPSPSRPALQASTREEADRLNRATSADACGISAQAFGILPKIRELDELMTPELQQRVIEVHPELSFYELNGRNPIIDKKQTAAGRKLRLELLESTWGRPVDRTVERGRKLGCTRDDVADAMAAAWTAERVLAGMAVQVPSAPPTDSRGFRMAITR